MEQIDNLGAIYNPAKLTLISFQKGGIGNQLFQQIFAQSLAHKLQANVLHDISFYAADPYNNQSVLQIITPQAKVTEIAKWVGEGTYILREGVLGSLHDQISLPNDAKVLVLDGYWQNEGFLEPSVVKHTYEAISQSQPALQVADKAREISAQNNALAIHLRRRDYAHMGICKESYYAGSINFLLKQFPDARLYVFSDEPNYAQQFLAVRYENLISVSTGNDIADLYLMSLCKHFVIANSSYSWWAAYFAEDKGGLIISPKEWITLEGVLSPCPERWVNVPLAVRPFAVSLQESAEVEQYIQSFKRQLSD
jgi:hypothetical protein